jgi:hypothetical protein
MVARGRVKLVTDRIAEKLGSKTHRTMVYIKDHEYHFFPRDQARYFTDQGIHSPYQLGKGTIQTLMNTFPLRYAFHR